MNNISTALFYSERNIPHVLKGLFDQDEGQCYLKLIFDRSP